MSVEMMKDAISSLKVEEETGMSGNFLSALESSFYDRIHARPQFHRFYCTRAHRLSSCCPWRPWEGLK